MNYRLSKIFAGSCLMVFAATAAAAPETASRVAARRPATSHEAFPYLPRTAIFHHATVQAAWQSAIARQRPLVVMFTSDHCRYCDKMLAETYGHPAIERMLATNCETVVADARIDRDLTQRMGIRAFPTSLVVSPQGKVVASVEGFVEPQEFANRVAPLLAASGKPSASPALT
ncbi:MAG: thioredoxin family protein, partial [Planctomycetota bacterium]